MPGRVGILYDNISGNTGDVAIGLSVKKILNDLNVEFDELVPGNFNPSYYEAIIIGGGHLLRPSPDFFYDKFKIQGSHILNAMGILDQVDDLHYLNDYKYLSVRSSGDREKLSYLNKDVSVVPCTTMLLQDLKEFSLDIVKPSIGIHLFPNFFSQEDQVSFINWAKKLPFKIYFIPITHYIHDYIYLAELSKKIDNSAVLPVMNPLEILTIIGKFDYFITCSLHGAIFSYIHNVPFIIYNYNEKMRLFVEDRGFGNYCFTSFDQIKSLVEEITERPPDYSKSIEADMQILNEHVRCIREALPASLSTRRTYKKYSEEWFSERLKSSNYQIHSLQMQTVDLFARLYQRDSLINEQEQQLNSKEQYINEKEEQLAFLKEQFDEQERQLQSLTKEIDEQYSILCENRNQISNLDKENKSLKDQVASMHLQRTVLEQRLSLFQNQLLLMENALGWRLIRRYRSIMDRLFPGNSGRRKLYESTQKFLKTILLDGPASLVRKSVGKKKEAEQDDNVDEAFLPAQKPDHTHTPIAINKKVEIADVAVSVVIPIKNAGDSLRYLLSMLRNQKGIRCIEIILVDSGSTDNTLEIARQFDARIIQIKPEQFSHSYARNLGAEAAAGEYILFTVQDALPPSDLWLYELYQSLKTDDIVAVSCIEAPRNDTDLFYRVISWNHYRFLEVLDGDRILSNPVSQDHIALRKNGQLSDIACLISKEIFLKYKYSGDYAEDLELGIKLIRDGYKLALLSSTKVLHSHNRPAYYHLKRGYVDNLFLTRIFLDYSPALISIDKLLPDILFTYCAINALVYKELGAFNLPCSVKDVAVVVTKTLESSPKERYSLKVDVASNQYIDDQFAQFLKKLSDGFGEGKIAYDGILIYGVINYVNLILEYMENTYDLVDETVLKDLKSSIFKAYAIVCGAQLACCYLCDFSDKREIVEQIDRELRRGI